VTITSETKPRPPRVLDSHWGDPRRDAILAFVSGFQESNGYGPSMREIAAGVGLTQAAAVGYHLDILEAGGCIIRTPGIARSIRVVEA
jgi:repressor LexA